MKEIRYYASQDELGVKKGQRVYPREEVLKIMNPEARATFSNHLFSNKKFFAPTKWDPSGWIYVDNTNPPIRKEIDIPEKDLFREWLAKEKKEIGEKEWTEIGHAEWKIYEKVLAKYEEIHGKPAEEPKTQPKTKKVFSLEKWVEKRMKAHQYGTVSKWFETLRGADGQTREEIDIDCFVYEPDLFIEVEDK